MEIRTGGSLQPYSVPYIIMPRDSHPRPFVCTLCTSARPAAFKNQAELEEHLYRIHQTRTTTPHYATNVWHALWSHTWMRYYYSNAATKAVTWNPPPGAQVLAGPQRPRDTYAAQQHSPRMHADTAPSPLECRNSSTQTDCVTPPYDTLSLKSYPSIDEPSTTGSPPPEPTDARQPHDLYRVLERRARQPPTRLPPDETLPEGWLPWWDYGEECIFWASFDHQVTWIRPSEPPTPWLAQNPMTREPNPCFSFAPSRPLTLEEQTCRQMRLGLPAPTRQLPDAAG